MGLGKGKVLMQTAAASVLGRLMIELSRIYGFDTVNIVRRQESADMLAREYGAEHVYVYDGTSDSGERVRTAIREDFSGRAIGHCIEAVGGDTARLCLDVLGPNGEIYFYGAMSGIVSLTIDTVADLAMNNNALKGWSTQEIWLRRTPDDVKQACVDELWSLFADGRLKMPGTDEIYPLDKVHDAVIASRRPGRSGKVLLEMCAD
jgi:NADPH:quinone reductase-like Zn-dependent oxidoreductase